MSHCRSAFLALTLVCVILQACSPVSATPSSTPEPAATEAATSPAGASPSPEPAVVAFEPDPQATARLAGVLSAPFTEGHTAAVIEALSRAGIAVYSDDLTTLRQPASGDDSGMRFSELQARGMAVEIAGHGGISGRQLNEMIGPIPLPDGGEIPISAILAAYIAEGEMFGASLTRELMGGSVDPADHIELVYPSLSLTFFLRDVLLPWYAAAQTQTGMMPERGGKGLAAPAMSSAFGMRLDTNPCQALSDFLDDIPEAAEQAVTEALEGVSDSDAWSVFVWVAGTVTRAVTVGAAELARQILRHNPATDAVRRAIDVIAGVLDLRSMFSQWGLSVTASPGSLHKSVGSAEGGEFTLTVTPPGSQIQYPPAMQSCAELFDIELPQLNSTDDASTFWEPLAGFPDLAVPGTASGLEGTEETYTFESASETTEDHESGVPEQRGSAVVQVSMTLPGMQDFAERLAGFSNSQALRAGVSVAAGFASSLLGPSTTGQATVTFHKREAAKIDLNTGIYNLYAVSCDGPYGVWNGTISFENYSGTSGSTPVSWQFDAGSNTAAFNWSAFLTGQIMNVTFVSNETLTLNLPGRMVSSSGSYTAMFDLNVPGAEDPPPVTGERNEDYTIDLGNIPECAAP